METTEKTNHRWIGSLILLALLIGLIIGVALGIELYQISSIKLGFWEANVEATHVVILSLRHQIQGSDKVRTIIEMGNTGAGVIVCNCTLYYKNTLGEHLATYSFNATINTGQIRIESFVVTPINVSQFVGTDISVFEY